MRAGTAFKKTPPALDHRIARGGVSSEGTSCWDQSSSQWALSSTGRWKVSAGEKDANASACSEGVQCPVFTTSGLCPDFSLPIPSWSSMEPSATLGSGWALDGFWDNFVWHR